MSDEYNPRGLWLPYSTIEEMRLKQNREIREAEEVRQRRAEERAAHQAKLARPSSRCGTTGTGKNDDGHCSNCEDIVAMQKHIEAAGGMAQTSDQLAERLVTLNLRFASEDEW